MYEVELKVPADHEEVRAAVDDIDATALGTVEQSDTYYDAPHRSFAATDEALRLRRECRDTTDSEPSRQKQGATESVLTYKGPLLDDTSKTRREIEFTVGDDAAVEDLLRALGFETAATVDKRRERYRIDDILLTLDAVRDLGEFVEVEAELPENDATGVKDTALAQRRDQLRSLLTDLGLDPTDGIRTSYLGMLLGDDVDRH